MKKIAYYKKGEQVVFQCCFSNADETIQVGNEGIVHKDGPTYYFVSVVAKGIIWLCKPNEIRKK